MIGLEVVWEGRLCWGRNGVDALSLAVFLANGDSRTGGFSSPTRLVSADGQDLLLRLARSGFFNTSLVMGTSPAVVSWQRQGRGEATGWETWLDVLQRWKLGSEAGHSLLVSQAGRGGLPSGRVKRSAMVLFARHLGGRTEVLMLISSLVGHGSPRGQLWSAWRKERTTVLLRGGTKGAAGRSWGKGMQGQGEQGTVEVEAVRMLVPRWAVVFL